MHRIRYVRRCDETGPSLAGLPDWMSSLLRARGIDTEEKARRFLSPSLADLYDPFLLDGMETTVSLLREAVARKQTILVYGDYDADGVCAASILLDALHEEGASLAYRIPSRHTEGYGLNEAAVREMAEKCDLLITVDCGISNAAEIALAKELGLTVVVTDHHQPPETLPPADAVINPLLGHYPFPSLCGAGVALKICQALQGIAGVEKRLDLAALATVADVVPLQDENRLIVREGLRRIAASSRPGLQSLLKVSGTVPPLSADHLAFRLGPRLNAAGRLSDARLGVHLLLTPDPAKAEQIARQLEETNRLRQDLERKMTAEALKQLEDPDLAGAHVLVVSGNGWNPGLVGLTAGRLCDRFHRPAVALSIQGETAVGSCRSIPGINIYRMLSACEDLLDRFGGHEQAAGLTVKAERLAAFRARLESVVADSAEPECFVPSREYDLSVPFRTWTPEALALLEQLEPTGCGNPPAQFRLEAEIQSMRRVGRDGSHLKLSLLDRDGSLIDGIAFSQGDFADELLTEADVLYRPVLNKFRGRAAVEAQITAINPV